MAAGKPITPKFYADTMLMTKLDITYNQTWDGVQWVLDPTTIILRGNGNVNENGEWVALAQISMPASDLPAAGQTALTDLYNFVEQAMADLYS